MNTIPCPHCGELVEVSEAFRHQIEQQTLKGIKEQHLKELEEAKKIALEQSSKKIREQFELQMKSIKEDADEKDLRIKELIVQITEMTKELRESKKDREEAEMRMQKKLSEESEKIRQEAEKKAQDEHRTKLLEKDKQLLDAMKEVEEMRRKLQQGSQQTQGEAFELDFEANLQSHYPHDKISPVAKGVKGADVIQEVWDSNGNLTGKIIFELKNTKTWSEGWVEKLKSDKRASGADEAVIITQVLPTNIKIAGYHDGVWVTKHEFVFPLTDSLRARLIHVNIVKNSLKGKDIKMESLYNYLTGAEFKNRIEGIVESFGSMQTEIEKEKRYFANKWARDEKNIRQVIDNTYGMHGDLKGILASAVPEIKGLELLEIDAGE